MGVSLPPHNILSPFHLDSTTAAVTRGGLIVGVGATPKWTLLTIGAANSVLVSDGTDTTWSTGPTVVSLTGSNSISATSTDGFMLTNPTAATVGAQKWSPRLRLTGQGWKTTATAGSQTVDWIIENQPVQGTANPTTTLVISSQVNAAGFTSQLTLTSAGALNLAGNLTIGGSTSGLTTLSSNLVAVTNGTNCALWTSTQQQLSSGSAYAWSSGSLNAASDTFLVRDASNVVAQKNSTTAQEFRIYGTTTGTKYVTAKHDGTDGTLDVSSGKLILGGTASDIQWGKALVALGAGAAPTLGTIGGSGPATAAQNAWMQVKDSTGAAFWVPVWK